MKISKILEVTKGKLISGNEEDVISNISTDTRKINPGDLYIGIKGENFDGNNFWEEAIKKGAKAVIVQGVEVNANQKENIIIVEDTLKALGQIAKYKRSKYNIPVVAITGSVGKTSTKDIVANVISQKYKTLKTEGNFNNHIGVPLTILGLSDHTAAVVEMGMNHEGEIRYLTNIAKPTLSVITNIGTSHIGYLGSRQNILKAKLEILEGMEKKKLVINNDNDLLHEFSDSSVEIKTFGIENKSDVMAKDIVLNNNSSEFTYKNTKITVPVGGMHFIYNALCGIAVGEMLGLTLEEIKKGIESFELTKKRMEIVDLANGAKAINDSYNASFESMKASLRYLADFKAKRKVAVLGDMLELGDYSEELHKKVGEEVEKNKIDILVCIGKEAKHIFESAKSRNPKSKYFEDKEEGTKYLKRIIESEDVVLFKASNGMKFYNIVENLKNP